MIRLTQMGMVALYLSLSVYILYIESSLQKSHCKNGGMLKDRFSKMLVGQRIKNRGDLAEVSMNV